MTGCIVFGSPVAPNTIRPPACGCSDADAAGLGAGLLSTAYVISYMATTFVTTGLADSVGPKRMVGMGLAVSAAGTVVFAASPTYAVALAAKAIQGIGSALAFVAAARYLAGLYGERRNHFALGLYGAGFPLGSAIALLAMPPLAASLGGWRGAFWIEAAFVGIATALWWSVPAVPPVPRP